MVGAGSNLASEVAAAAFTVSAFVCRGGAAAGLKFATFFRDVWPFGRAARHDGVEKAAVAGLDRAVRSRLLSYRYRRVFERASIDHCANVLVDCDFAYPLNSCRSGLALPWECCRRGREQAIDVHTFILLMVIDALLTLPCRALYQTFPSACTHVYRTRLHSVHSRR